MSEIFEVENFESIPPNGEAQEDEVDNISKCKTCGGEGGWDEEAIDPDTGEEYDAWVICDDCDGTGDISE